MLLTIPEHNVHIQLTGTVTSAKTVLSPPASRMSDEDIATLAQIRQSIDEFHCPTATNSATVAYTGLQSGEMIFKKIVV